MKGIIRTITIAVVGLFFMLSACEISTAYFSNTFEDDYDYYIQPDNSQTTNVFIKTDIDFTFVLVPHVSVFTLVEISTFSILKPYYFEYYSSLLYLKNHVLLV